MIDDAFLKQHGILSINSIAEGTMVPVIMVKFDDGREAKKRFDRGLPISTSIEKIVFMILKEENIKFRKMKIEKIMKNEKN